jgi:sensor histidine kinase YesM
MHVISRRSSSADFPSKGRLGFHRPGIMGKILICFGIIIIFFLVLALVMQNESMNLSREYSKNLSNYLLVHRFRLNLNSFHSQADRYLRELASVEINSIYDGILLLNSQYVELLPIADISIYVEFEVRATGYGLDAYFPLVSRAVGLRAGNSPDYYQVFVNASRIHGYIDIYLNRMLSELMKNGEETYVSLSHKAEILNRTIFFSMIFASAIAIGVILFVTQAITAPLRRLAKEAEKLAKGDLDAGIVEVHTGDEVETLTRSFATMAMSIREYVEGLKEKSELERLLHEEELALVSMGKALREAQFLNLQEQMKPHFLFNALNTIARSALLENAPRTESLAICLATLLRATIKDSGALSTLDEELVIAQAYLEFQQVRFGDRLQWNIDVPRSLRKTRVPRLMIQPIVENSVRHALEPKVSGGFISIKAQKRKEGLVLWFLDNGIGMSKDRLADVRAKIAASLQVQSFDQINLPQVAEIPFSEENDVNEEELLEGRSIGLANIATRFGILYGDSCRFEINSRKEKGTLVRITLPLGEKVG